MAAKGGVGQAIAVEASTLSATITGLSGGSATTVAVSAVSSCGTGPRGTSASVTPTGRSTSYAAAVIASAPVAYYRLGESGTVGFGADSSGKGVLATWGSDVAFGAPGALGSADPDTAVTADGGCCVATSASKVPLYNSARTVEAWVKPSDSAGRWFVGWGSSDTDKSFDVGVQGSSVLVDAYNDAIDIPIGKNLVDGMWHYVAVTSSGATVTAYVDGVTVGSRDLAGTPDTLDDSGLVIGAFENGGGAFYGGLDEVAIYPTALSASTVSAHFAASGFARPAAPTHVSATDGADNEAVVSWAAGPTTNPRILRYVITAISRSGVRSTSAIVTGGKTAARVTGLAGGASYTFAVAAGNAFGLGPESVTGAATMTGPAAPYAASVAADSPSAYFRLGEPAGSTLGADSSGRGHLLEYNQVTLRTDGGIPDDADTAATANGSCCIGVAYPVLPAYNSARTVEFWARPADTNGRWVTGWGRRETDMGFNVGLSDRAIIVSGWSDDLTFPTGRTLVDGAWHQVAVTYDGTTVSAYLDGAALGSQTFLDPLDTVDESGLQVGAALDGGSPYYGDLDDIAVYPTSLTATRVRAHFIASGHAAPSAVTALTATSGTNKLTVKWTAPAAGSDPITSYVITVLNAGVPINAIAAGPSATSVVLTGLPGGIAVTARVVADDAYGPGPSTISSAATPTGSSSTYASAVLAQHPQAYYRLGEAPTAPVVADSSGAAPVLQIGQGGYGLAGSLATDPDTSATANGGCCLASGAVDLPSFNDSRSVEAWVKPADTSGRWFIGWGGANGTDTAFNVGVQDSLILVSAQSDDLSFQAPRSLVDGLWHHIVVTYDGTSARAYVDGVGLGSKSFVDALDTSDAATLYIGAYANGGGAWYGGLDEVAVYPSVLSATTISAHFTTSGHGAPGPVTGLTVAGGTNSASVSWTAPQSKDRVSGYLVTAYRGATAINAQSVGAGDSTTTLSGLPGGTAYTFRVVAINGYGSGASATSSAVTPTGASTTYSGTVIADGTTAYYRLGDGAGSPLAADSSGRNHPASYGQATLGQGSALRSDADTAVTANGGCCVLTALPTLPSANTARSVEAWVRPSDTSGRWIVAWGTSSTRTAFNVGVQDSNVLVSAYSDDLTIPVGHTLVDGAWHHLVVTYDGSVVTAYVDAVALPSRKFAGTLHTGAASRLTVGAFVNGGGAYYGDLDEVAIYPLSLSASAVKRHFTASGHALPTAVSGLTVTARTNGVAVSWSAATSGDGVVSYLVTAVSGGNARNARVVAGTATSTTLTGLPGGAAVTVRVEARNGYGSGPIVTSASVTPTGSATTYASTVLAQSPSAYYRLGEGSGLATAADSSGNAATLTTQDGTFGTSGAVVGDVDTAVNADGGSPVGSSNAHLSTFNGARSVEAWVKPSDGQLRWFVGWGTNATDRAFDVGNQDDTIVVSAYADDLDFAIGHSIVDGAWHHVVATYDGTSAAVYLDGRSLRNQTFHAKLNTVTSGVLHVGAAQDGSGAYYGGLDEVAVYPAALTAAQALAHYTAGGHRAPGAPTAVATTARANGVTVSWTPAGAVVDGTARFVVTAYRGSTAINAQAVPGTATSTVLTGLPGGTAVTVTVVAGNAYGSSSASTSGSATPTGSTTTYASTVLADVPIAYYRLGDAASSPVLADSSGKAGLATVGQGAVTLGATGALPSDPDKAATPNGNCCVGSAYASSLPRYNNARTVEAWVQPSDTNGRWFLGWGTGGTREVFDVGVQDDSVIVASYGDDLAFPIGHSIVDGAWHDVVVTYDGTTARAYVDGTSLGSKAFSAALNTVSNGYLRLGAGVDGSSPTYGRLDEISIYNSVLSQTRISAHYAAR